MTDVLARLAAVHAIRTAKARYFRGVDTSDGALVRSILAEDCVLDYRGCGVDPTTGVDWLPQMGRLMQGRASFGDGGFKNFGVVAAHQGNDVDITLTDADHADVIFAFSDRLWFPEGAPIRQVTGWGYYYETYVRDGDAWLIQTTRIQRLRVEGIRA